MMAEFGRSGGSRVSKLRLDVVFELQEEVDSYVLAVVL
jgi:hypothetical protein